MAEQVETLQYNELAVLGNILSDSTGNQILTAVQYLTADDFTDTRNQAVFHAMLEINSKGQTPDLATVIDTLKNNKVFDAIGGLDYLNTCRLLRSLHLPNEGPNIDGHFCRHTKRYL